MMTERPLMLRFALIICLAAGWAGTSLAQDPATTEPAIGEIAPAVSETPPEPIPVPPPPQETKIDYPAWERVARRAEQALEAGRASDQALQALRSELVTWRELLSKAKAENTIRINTLKTQISTLGPPPTEGGTEPAILTERRAELTVQLDELEAPVKAAGLAHTRANALITEIDNTIRSRQTDELFALGPTPLNPANWPKAVSDLTSTLRLTWAGITSSWSTETQRAALRKDLPLTLLLAVLALVLLTRGRTWVIRLGAGVRSHAEGAAEGVWSFLLSLGQVAAPLAGVYALVEALHAAGILGLRAQLIADALPVVGLCFFAARWLGNRVFGTASVPWAVLDIPGGARAEGRYEAAMLGLLFGVSILLSRLSAYETYSPGTFAVLSFPLIVGAGLLLIRLGRILQKHGSGRAIGEEGGTFRSRTMALSGRLLMLVGFAAPVAAAIGYGKLADQITFPSALTLALVAALAVFHRFFVDLYAFIAGKDESEASEALVPVLVSFVLTVLSLPVLALIWGARITDLTELWTRAQEGVTIGETVISPSDFVMFLVIFTVGYTATRLVQGMLKNTILPRTKIDLGGRNAITSGVGYVGIFLAALAAITSAGLNLSSLAIVFGALSVGIGFGLQNIVSNFVSGIILLIERPISEGDWIEAGGHMGYVRDISVRSTRIETFDRTDVVVPNSDLISGVVTNYTRGNLLGRVIVPVGVAYGTDTRKVEAILREVAEAHPLVTINPPPNVVFQGFGADSLDFEIRAILKDVNYILSAKSDMNHEIARRFTEEGIEIPFAQRDIWLRNPEVLTGAKPKKPKAAKKTGPAEVQPQTTEAAAREALDETDIAETYGYGQEDKDD
jgi:potassium efflux system protein